MKKEITDLDRLAVRSRPDGIPIMHQNWGKLLYIHWPISPAVLRPLIPEKLEIDTYGASAWIGIIPFTMWNVRASFLPPVPGLSEMHELNVRTYVHYDNVPGVWFFSLDITSALAVVGARTLYHLPYYNADIELDEKNNRIDYRSRRTEDPPAEFEATYTYGDTLPYTHPGSLEFFLSERYCLYSARENHLYRARIFHGPWPLRTAELPKMRSTMIEALGISTPKGEPHLLYSHEGVSVDIWPIEEIKKEK